MTRAIFLVGFMACGKTTVGRCLAQQLCRDFVDLDARIEQLDGRPIARILAEEGTERFRQLEGVALRSPGTTGPVVVACGGGILESFPARRWIARWGTSVWLDVSLEVARQRIAAAGPRAPARPLWIADDPVGLRALYERRRAVYALAAIRVDGAPGEPETIAGRIRARILDFSR